ncbi:MAG: short-chain fatty acid transporter [Nevskia sp.]|nr:short-chain fatty acid transporter [Nevskia sp.]
MAASDADHHSLLSRSALRCCAWAERWFPDAWVFTALAVLFVAAAAMAAGAAPTAVANAFGDGFWSLITFTMQMSFIIIGGYVVASAPPVARAIDALAAVPRSGRAAVCWVALLTTLVSLLHWGLSIVFGGLLVRSLARRTTLNMDYRAASASAYLGIGAVWALGLSSSAAQLEANPASQPAALLHIGGVIPFSETIFLWQSLLLTAVLIAASVTMAWLVAPGPAHARTAQALGVSLEPAAIDRPTDGATSGAAARRRPADWLELNPLINLALAALGLGWLLHQFASLGASAAIASFNTYNLLFLSLGLLLHWRPRPFLDAVTRAVPGTAGVLIQFPLYAGISGILTLAKGAGGLTLTQHLSGFFAHVAGGGSFPLVVGVYSAILGFFVPSGGGKWIIEAPYVLQAANDVHAHLGWAVQVYNAAEALPNLINPFWMLPLLGIVGLKARDLIGFTFVQFLVNVPLVLFLLWALGLTLAWHPPVMP